MKKLKILVVTTSGASGAQALRKLSRHDTDVHLAYNLKEARKEIKLWHPDAVLSELFITGGTDSLLEKEYNLYGLVVFMEALKAKVWAFSFYGGTHKFERKIFDEIAYVFIGEEPGGRLQETIYIHGRTEGTERKWEDFLLAIDRIPRNE